MSTFDKEWLENEAWYAGFTEGKDSLSGELRLMFVDLVEAFREDMLEVHPSSHLTFCVGLWALRLNQLGLMSDEEKMAYFELSGMEEADLYV